MPAVGRLWPSDNDDDDYDERRQAGDDQISQPGALSQIKDLVESGQKTSLQLKTEQAV